MRAGAVFSFSDAFSGPGLVAVDTAARHLPEGVELVVVSSGLSPAVETALQENAAAAGRALTLIPPPEGVGSLPIVSRYVADTWARMFIGEILPSFGRVLYLDADTITVGALAPLFELDLEGWAVAALPDPTFPDFSARGREYAVATGLPGSTPYFNTGVLVIDRPVWADLEVGERARALVADGRLPLEYVDQDVLNVVLAGRWTPLDPRFHHLVPGSVIDGSAFVVHFTGPVKPWLERDRSSARWSAYRDTAETGGWKW